MSKKEEKRFNIVITVIIGIFWIGILAMLYINNNNINLYELFNKAPQKEISYQEATDEAIIPDVLLMVDTPSNTEETKIILKDQVELATNTQTYSPNEANITYNIAKTKGEVEQRYIDIVEEELLKLPNLLVESFIEEDWSIYVTSEDIAKTYLNGRVKRARAVTSIARKEIIIEARDAAVYGSVQHEFGHYMGYICGEVGWTEEFAQIYYEESETLQTRIDNPGCISDQGEFFAETFSLIINEPDKCTPKASEFVKSYMKLYYSNNIPDNKEFKFEIR